MVVAFFDFFEVRFELFIVYCGEVFAVFSDGLGLACVVLFAVFGFFIGSKQVLKGDLLGSFWVF